MPMNCPASEALRAFLLGQGDETQSRSIEAHLADCPGCLRRLQDLEASDPFVDVVKAGGRPLATGAEIATEQLSRLCRLQSPSRERAQELPSITAPTPFPVKALAAFDFLDPAEAADELGRLAGYRVLKVLGHGGMGVVFQAENPRLGRIVALKVILEARALQPQYLARFQAEGAALARLQHPNIVQIYEVGEHRGRPYLVLEHVPGGNLAHRLVQQALSFRASVALVATLARAMHYAHQQGIIHRDLKPANILLARIADRALRSEENKPPVLNPQSASLDPRFAKITDFGLAKRLDEAGLTETGDMLGTPGYMAPELTRGAARDIGALVDVYSLGAIFYELLTGRAPFRGETIADTLEQARTQEPVPPRRLLPRLPRDLQTICLKCLAKEPRRRYNSAADLADDLDRYLAGQPITARPVRPWERVWKWVRRQPTAAALVGLLMLSFLGVVLGILVHNARLQEAAAVADRQHQLADARYQAARASLRRMLDRLDDSKLASVPALEELRKHLLEDSLVFYDTVLRQADNPDPEVRLDAVFALVETAGCQWALSQPGPARANIQRAMELLEALPDEYRARPEGLNHLAICHKYLGRMAHVAKKWDEAERHYRAMLAIFERLDRQQPQQLRWQNELARGDYLLGHLSQDAGRLDQAETHYLRAVARRVELVRIHSANASLQVQLAETYQNLGTVYAGKKRWPKAQEVNDKARRLLEPLADEKHLSYRMSLAAVYCNAGEILKETGQTAEAVKTLTRAVELAEDGLQKEPNLSDAMDRAYSAHGQRALVYEALRRWADAAEDWGRVAALERGPDGWRWRIARALALARAGDHARAAAEAKLLEKEPKALAGAPYNLACVYALAAAAACQDTEVPAAERQPLAGRYAAQALALLLKLQAQGYFRDAGHAKTLATDDDLNALHGRVDFQHLLKQVKSRKK